MYKVISTRCDVAETRLHCYKALRLLCGVLYYLYCKVQKVNVYYCIVATNNAVL